MCIRDRSITGLRAFHGHNTTSTSDPAKAIAYATTAHVHRHSGLHELGAVDARLTFSAGVDNGKGILHEIRVSSVRQRKVLRHRFSPKPKVIAIENSLPKRNRVAKEAVSAAWQTSTRQRSERICKPNDAPRTKPRSCVKTMLCGVRNLSLIHI